MSTSTKMNIPITKLYLGEEEVEAVRKVLESGWLVQGDKVVEFENMVKDMVGAKHAVACGNCTEALHMAVRALGIGKGDRVAVPAYTFVSTPNAVEYVGGEVVFVDIDLETFNIDTDNLPLRESYSAIIPVHLFGLCADMPGTLNWAEERACVIEDAACSLGASCFGKMAGAIGDIGCFSFHPRKSVTTGEGGMVTTNRDNLARRVHALRDFGFEITDLERHQKGQLALPQVEMLGYNYRMTNMQGAIGVEQMRKYNYIVGERMRLAEIYNRELAGLDWLRIPVVPKEYKHTYQSYCLLVGGNNYPRSNPVGGAESYIKLWSSRKDRLVATFKDKGIAIRGGTHACHMLPYYARKYNLKPMDFPNTAIADALLVTIPLFASMTEDEQQYIIDAIKEVKV
jgi:dTDP-4-amino-4,6-dideoxygalactose transaminase